MGQDVVEWIFELFEEIEEPTMEQRAEAFSLLYAEAEDWNDKKEKQ